ncbi:alginate export family protein [Stutzerimonas stutzeri]|uniref:alginate export family protein n=1 Tax=Stutzerimonas stutzeri TaxID=316 RepID=UPI0015E36AA0|nr:alginate export family protein [Stutzerimonas stutzeri]MBA1261468.1 alginate export family protein [Stutzerimonas stutzeri]
MSSIQPSRLALALLAAGLAVNTAASAEENFSNLFTEAKPIFDLRYRYEHVDQDNALRHANAQTLRTRIGVQTGSWYGLSALVEADNLSRLGKAAYNNTRNGQTDYSAVPDPDGSEINQALLRYDHAQGSAVVGRQRINLDNQRFVGGVGWRQNEQTYDGLLGQLKPIDGLALTYAYIDNINSIFGPEDNRFDNFTNPANIEGHSHLINARYQAMPELTVTAYSYLLGLDNIASVNSAAMLGSLSSKTTGVRLNGAVQGVSYVLEYARQKDYADNPLELSSEYYLAELGYTIKGVALKGGMEVLGGDSSGAGNRAFQTPLATKHAFQGWADTFLLTPADGVQDVYVGGSLPLFGGTLQLWYHDFRAERGSQQYGEELDISYSRAIPLVKGLVATVKYAGYDADDFSVDTEKLWAQLQYSY